MPNFVKFCLFLGVGGDRKFTAIWWCIYITLKKLTLEIAFAPDTVHVLSLIFIV